MNFIKKLYYKLKYRGCAVAIAVFPENKSNNIEKYKAFAKTAVACKKTNAEVLEYLKKGFELKEKPMSETELNMFKANFILNNMPNVLLTPEITLGKKHSRKEFLAYTKNNDLRFSEALRFPIEKTNIDVIRYSFDFENTTILITFENTYDNITLSFKAVDDGTEKFAREINILKGVSQFDIDNLTPRFLSYAHDYFIENNL